MGHSFLYSRNFMFSRNALFWKVTGSKKLTIKTSHIWDISDPSESRSLKLYLVNYQNQDQGSIYEKKKITFSFSSTKDFWGLDFKQLRDQAGLYEEAGMAMNALWEVRIAQLFFPETKIRLLTGALLGWHFLFHWRYSCLISSSKGVYENLYSTIFNQHLTGPW